MAHRRVAQLPNLPMTGDKQADRNFSAIKSWADTPQEMEEMELLSGGRILFGIEESGGVYRLVLFSSSSDGSSVEEVGHIDFTA